MESKAVDILKQTIYAVIATSTPEGEPWNSPVYIVYDDQLNFYWASGIESQHSRNIRMNRRAFLTIFNSADAWGTGQGLFIEADATEVTDLSEIKKACALRKVRVTDAKHPPEDFVGDRPRRIYRASAKRTWVNVDGSVDGRFVDQRAELDLQELKKLLTRQS